jgi:hypothetical protein
MTNVVTQVVRQAQIGCLYWCFDATQQQIATTEDTLTAIAGDNTPPVSPPQGSASPPAPGSEPEPPPAAPVTSPVAGGDATTGASGGPATTAPVRLAEPSAVAASILRELAPHSTTHPSHKPAARAAAGPVGRNGHALAASPATLHANVRSEGGARVKVPRIAEPLRSLAGEAQRAPVAGAATDVPAAALLTVLVLFGICGAGVAGFGARRKSNAGRQRG